MECVVLHHCEQNLCSYSHALPTGAICYKVNKTIFDVLRLKKCQKLYNQNTKECVKSFKGKVMPIRVKYKRKGNMNLESNTFTVKESRLPKRMQNLWIKMQATSSFYEFIVEVITH